jgi:hypothetical protein
LAAIDARTFDTALIVVRNSLLALALARWPEAGVIQIGQRM